MSGALKALSMVGNGHFNQILQYTAFAISALRAISATVKNPLLQSAASLTDAILSSVPSSASSKKKVAAALLEQVHIILCLIVQLYSHLEVDGIIPPDLAHDVAAFNKTLQKLYSFLETQQSVGKVKQFLRPFGSAAQVKVCEEEFQEIMSHLLLRISGMATTSLAHTEHKARQRHEELIAHLKTLQLDGSVCSLATSETRSSMGSSSLSLTMLPPAPKIFYGRNLDLESISNQLKAASPRIVVLGPAGIGKSSLAISVLHHAAVAEIFPNRYFVPCRSMRTGEDIVVGVASHAGVIMGPSLVQRVVRHLADGPPALLILDNFETPWEATSTRGGVEEFLSLLSEVSQLAILITMRGTERPNRVKWTHPFLPPLRPLDESAALQTFFDIAGDSHEESSVKELLALTGNLPLAVSLVANVAVYETCESILSRWQTEATRVLSEGCDENSSLDISIMFSVSSPRMTPEAQALLSVLALLPEGLSPAELIHSNLPIRNILEAKSTLIRTSLAYVSHRNRLLLLVPIREYIRAKYQPSSTMKAALRAYYRDVVDISPAATSVDNVDQAFVALSNFHAIFKDGLTDATANDVTLTLDSTMRLEKFKHIAGCSNEIAPLMPHVGDSIKRFVADPVYGLYLLHLLSMADHQPMENLDEVIVRGTKYFEHATEIEKAKWYFELATYNHHQGRQSALKLFNETALVGVLKPNTLQPEVSVGFATLLFVEGHYSAAQSLARKAQQSAAALGNLYLKAEATAIEARCFMQIGRFVVATDLLHRARILLKACGLVESDTNIVYQNYQAYVTLCKTDYPAARAAFTRLVENYPNGACYPKNLLNIAIIDTITGAPAAEIRMNIDLAGRQLFAWADRGLRNLISLSERAKALLLLREGDVEAARQIFRSLVDSRLNTDLVAFALERLADLENGMNDVLSTLRWGTIYLAHAMLTWSKLDLMKSLRCLGQIAAANNDMDTAMAFFEAALDGFTEIDVHWWRADCMLKKADILTGRGELMQARELLLAARPLFIFCLTQNRVDYINLQLRSIDTK